MSAGPFHAGLESLVVHLANRGILVVAYAELANGIQLLCAGGHEVTVARAALGGRTDALAQEIADWWPHERLNVTPQQIEVIEVGERTAHWWRFLRWQAERDRGEWERITTMPRQAGAVWVAW